MRDVRADRDAPPDVPLWAVVIGAALVLVFVGLSANAYFGGNLLGRLKLPGATREPVAVTGTLRAFYSPADTASPGMTAVGTRGHIRQVQPGEVVLLGGSGRLVRMETDGVTELVADSNTTVTASNLGAWDEATGRLAGQPARLVDGRWTVEKPPAAGMLSLDGLRDDQLPPGFAIVPTPSAGRARRTDDSDGASLRIRAAETHAFVGFQTHALATMPDETVVTIWALVRARDDATIGLRLSDVVDATGTREDSIGRWPAPRGWTRVTLARRLTYRTPEDRFAVGLIDPRPGDWLDVRDVGIYPGALP